MSKTSIPNAEWKYHYCPLARRNSPLTSQLNRLFTIQDVVGFDASIAG